MKKRIKVTIEFVLPRNTFYRSIETTQKALDRCSPYELNLITNDIGKVVAIESIPDNENLPA